LRPAFISPFQRHFLRHFSPSAIADFFVAFIRYYFAIFLFSFLSIRHYTLIVSLPFSHFIVDDAIDISLASCHSRCHYDFIALIYFDDISIH